MDRVLDALLHRAGDLAIACDADDTQASTFDTIAPCSDAAVVSMDDELLVSVIDSLRYRSANAAIGSGQR